jgi:hypothetical protein
MARNRLQALVSANVRFGSKADICGAPTHVRFTPISDRESGFPQPAMSASPPKADMCGAARDVRFRPIADMRLRTIVVETMVPEAVLVAASMTCIIANGSCGLSFPLRIMRPSLVDQIKLRVAVG